eukprot:Opistho-2@45863
MMASGGKRRSRAAIIISAAVVVVIVGGAAAAFVWFTRTPENTVPKAQSEAIEHPLTPAEQIVADANDPRACAVTFTGEGAPAEPMLQFQESLYQGLPIPQLDGRVFAGWYPSAADAGAFAVAARVNGADPVVCVDPHVLCVD